jgi:Tfp pilus assembly protein FimT
MKNFYKKGISVVELLVVFAVLAVIFSVVIPQFSKIREQQVLKSAVGDILSSLNKAQTRTLASVDASSYGVHFSSSEVIIFKGTVFSEGSIDNEVINIISPATISTITLTGGGANIFFNRLSGAPSVTGFIIVSSTNFTKTITISATGSASVN